MTTLNIYQQMLSIFYKIIWTILHTSVTIYESFYWLCIYIQIKVVEYLYSGHINEQSLINYERNVIEKWKCYFTKIPTHIIVILGKENPNYKSLSNLIFWSARLGVNYISFYDYKGTLKENKINLKKVIKDRQETSDDDLQIAWDKFNVTAKNVNLINDNINNNISSNNNSSHIYNNNNNKLKNGYKRHINVNIFNEKDGKSVTGVLCRELSVNILNNNLNINDIDIQLIDKNLLKIYNYLPDPELALYFDNNCCTYGLLPWQIRLTEFHCLNKQFNLTIDKYINVLHKYAKCEQRFGK